MSFESFLPALKEKWRVVPSTTQGRIASKTLLDMNSGEFMDEWLNLYSNNCFGSGFGVRGWYHELYKPLAGLGQNWLEVGSGLGFDGVFFAECGARVTFFDIIEDNLLVIERVCNSKRLTNCDFKLLSEIKDINFGKNFDVVLAVGSLINAPLDMMSEERAKLASYLNEGGRWIELAYPKSRWQREGEMPFDAWGIATDGEGTPWVEWYDLEKLLGSLSPYKFDLILDYVFDNGNFIMFDLKKCESA